MGREGHIPYYIIRSTSLGVAHVGPRAGWGAAVCVAVALTVPGSQQVTHLLLMTD